MYVMDTSSLIDGELYFSQARNQKLWQKLGALAAQGRMAMPAQAFDEISPGNKALRAWVSARRASLVVPGNADIINLARDVVEAFPCLVDTGKAKPDADPYIIALAVWLQTRAIRVHAPIIVTEEADRPSKMPRVARHYNVPPANFSGRLRKEGWRPDGPAGA